MDKLMEMTQAELIELIIGLREVIERQAIEIEELKARLGLNSTNSSKPPSSDGLSKVPTKSLREKSGKKPGGQKGHKGSGLKIDREPDAVIVVEPVSCACGCGLEGEPTFHVDTRYSYDVEVTVTLKKYDIREAVCPECGSTARPEIPAGINGSVNYGNTLRALCVVLTQYACVGIDKTHKILHDLVGLPISTGTIKNIQSQFAGLTDKTIGIIKQNLRESPVINADETGARVDGRTQWIHVASNSKYTLLTVHRKRGGEGSAAGGVLPGYTGTLVHDCWRAYFGFDRCRHAVCCAHLLRELNALIETGKHQWASEMKGLLLEMKKTVEGYKSKSRTELSRYYRTKFKARYEDIVALANGNVTKSTTRKKTKAENLLKRLEEYRGEVTRFAEDFDVPFDNNQAERDVRNVKVKQKVTGGHRTDDGAEEYAKTMSVIGTVVKFGQSVFNAVRGLFAGVAPDIGTVSATE